VDGKPLPPLHCHVLMRLLGTCAKTGVLKRVVMGGFRFGFQSLNGVFVIVLFVGSCASGSFYSGRVDVF